MQSRTTLLLLLLVIHTTAFAQSFSVYFRTDKSELEPEARSVLDSLVSSKTFSDGDSLLISCHCDIRADSAYNYALSMRRAKSVRHYLQKSGLANNMVLRAFGEENPAFANDEAVRFKNRRCDVALKANRQQSIKLTDQKVEDWKPGLVLQLDSLEFVGNQAVPNDYSMPVLYEVLTIMKRYPDLNIALHGHVCCGSNMPLSVARAKAVYDFLIAGGIDSSRMTYAGFDNAKPLVAEVDEASMQRNRRVEMIIVKQPKDAVEKEPIIAKTFYVALLDVPFKQNTPVLLYNAEYNLSLLAEMIKASSGYAYHLHVYARNRALQQKRFQVLGGYFKRQGVNVNKFKVTPGKDKAYANHDVLILEVKPLKE